MQRRVFIVVLAVLLTLILLSWKRDGQRYGSLVIIRPMAEFPKAKLHLGQALPRADAETRRLINEALRLFERNDYQGLAAALLRFGARMRPTFEQARTLNGLYLGLQQEITASAEQGHADALRAAEILKERPCCIKP